MFILVLGGLAKTTLISSAVNKTFFSAYYNLVDTKDPHADPWIAIRLPCRCLNQFDNVTLASLYALLVFDC